MAYCIAMVLMFLKVFLMVTMGILRLFSSIFIDGMWVVARALAVMTISTLRTYRHLHPITDQCVYGIIQFTIILCHYRYNHHISCNIHYVELPSWFMSHDVYNLFLKCTFFHHYGAHLCKHIIPKYYIISHMFTLKRKREKAYFFLKLKCFPHIYMGKKGWRSYSTNTMIHH
jgi:hypothetical protein